jgi:hypothetical protein
MLSAQGGFQVPARLETMTSAGIFSHGYGVDAADWVVERRQRRQGLKQPIKVLA